MKIKLGIALYIVYNMAYTHNIYPKMSQLSEIQSLPREEARRYLWEILLNAGYCYNSCEITFKNPKDHGMLMQLQEEGYIELHNLPKL